MPTQRDDAAYKKAYDGALNDKVLRRNDIDRLAAEIGNWSEVGRVVGPDRYFGRLDGMVEQARERGLCSSVLQWHTRPARADDLEW